MNCWIESCLIHSGRKVLVERWRHHKTGFVRAVRWAIDRPHRKPSRRNAPDSHCGWNNHREQVSLAGGCQRGQSRVH